MKRICFERMLPRDLHRLKAMTVAAATVDRMASVITKQWVNGSTLRIKFMGGTKAQQNMVRELAPEWCEYANLKFVFGDEPDSEVRISFDESGGAWSYIGTDCREIPFDQPTMNLGWQDKAVILHETGHSLALGHEHSSPAGGIQWNREQVIKDLSGPPNFWDAATIEHNVFQKYAVDQINGTELDPLSIMMYSFPASWTTDGWHTEENNDLSVMDKAFIASAKMYPKPKAPSPVQLPISNVTELSATIFPPGEEDLYALTITEDGNYVVQTGGFTDCLLALYGPTTRTTLIAKDDDGGIGRNALIDIDLKAGNYWVSVRHYSKLLSGDYRISVVKKLVTPHPS